jgi:succinyl-diaminopimelate desuccinylase
MYDFYEEVIKRKDDIINDIITLCKIPSVLDESSAKEGQPFGQACKEALDAMIELGKRDGFVTDNCDGYAGHIDIGDSEETFGILGHLDVVPCNKEGWNSDPYNPVIINDVLYGRGVADDKGPLIAGYYAAKIINELNIPTKMKTRIIFGCNEENGSECVEYYFKHRPYPKMGFTPDAEFPVVFGEKAICRVEINGSFDQDNIIGIYAGNRPNVVPGSCEAYVQGNYKQYEESFNNYLDEHQLKGNIEEEGNHTKLTLVGKSAHGSLPQEGINAAVFMCHYLRSISSNKFVEFIDRYFYEDYTGVKLKFRQTGRLGGPTINLGIVTYKNQNGSIVLDCRLSDEITEERVELLIDKAIKPYKMSETHEYNNALYIDPNSELITKLHNSYVEFTNDHEHKPQAIGGGTYAKEMPNCVAFGVEFPGENNQIHQDNEKISIESLLKATAIYTKALYELIKAD